MLDPMLHRRTHFFSRAQWISLVYCVARTLNSCDGFLVFLDLQLVKHGPPLGATERRKEVLHPVVHNFERAA